jgi:type IX secretion system PorP/SprF family membrane protein
MKKNIVNILLVLSCVSLFGQQQPLFTNYFLNDYYFNPATAGSKDVTIASFSYKNQWLGFEGAPKTMMGNISGSIKNEGKHGYGATVVSDKIGLTSNLSLLLTYAYHIKINDKLKLGLGLQTGYLQNSVKLYDTKLADIDDEVFSGNILTENGIDFNTGFHLYSDKYYFMAAVNHLFIDNLSVAYNQRLEKNYNVIAGYKFSFEKKKIELEPSLMVQYVKAAPTNVTSAIKTTYDKKYWLGLSYNNSKSVGLGLGYVLKERLNLGYAYNMSLSELNTYHSGSHEISISYILTHKKPSFEEEDAKLNNSIMDEMKKKLEQK